MKTFSKLILYIFSFIMIVVSVVCLIISLGWINPSIFTDVIVSIMNNHGAKNVFIAFNIVVLILGLIGLFYHSKSDGDSSSHGVLLENKNGKLMISKETIEDIVNSVTKEYSGVSQTTVNVVLNSDDKIDIYLTLSVNADVNIKDLSTTLQNKIKEKIKQITDIDINEVNIKVKNITPITEQKVQTN